MGEHNGNGNGNGGEIATKSDLREVLLDLREQIRDGFQGVHARQDVTNGRVGKAEVALGEHGVRLTNVEREVFRRRRSDSAEGGNPVLSFDRHSVSVRDLRMFTIGVLVVVGVLLFFSKVMPALVKVVLP